MSSTMKLMRRLPNRSIISKLSLSSHRYIAFSRCELHPTARPSSCHHHHDHQCGPSCHHHRTHWFSTTSHAQDKEDEVKAEDNDAVEESESGEESDNEQSQQIADLEAQVQSLSAEVAKYKEALARRSADIMNLQNMSKKDVENARKFATKAFSKDMLNVADALQGCLSVVEQHTKDGKELPSAEIKSVIEGVRITHSTLLDTFGRHDIKKIDALHEEFDPNFHEALFKMPSDEHPQDTVVQVVSEGYTIKDAVLRAAKVGVSTAPPTPVQPETESEDAPAESVDADADDDSKKKE